jgi:hypothetical protein
VYPLYSPSIPRVIPLYNNRGGLQGDYTGYTGGILVNVGEICILALARQEPVKKRSRRGNEALPWAVPREDQSLVTSVATNSGRNGSGGLPDIE